MYDQPPQARSETVHTAAALAERVVELETIVHQLQEQLTGGGNDALRKEALGTASASPLKTFIAERALERLLGDKPEYRASSNGNGRLVSESGSSRHLLDSFWAGRYEDVRAHFRGTSMSIR